jgi:HAD superfamily phosphatase
MEVEDMGWRAIAIFDIDGVIRDVSQSYRRALADTVEHFTQGTYRPTSEEIDQLKAEGRWNNDWEAAQELLRRYGESTDGRRSLSMPDFDTLVDFFQRRYRGPFLEDPQQWTGYITQEPLLANSTYFDQLTTHNIGWGFFSGATRGSATYVLEGRLGLTDPCLVAMEDAPGKPDPTGFFQVLERLIEFRTVFDELPILYVGDTVADMLMVQQARKQRPAGQWLAVGILPPHVVALGENYAMTYAERLRAAGALMVLPSVEALTPIQINHLIADNSTGHLD